MHAEGIEPSILPPVYLFAFFLKYLILCQECDRNIISLLLLQAADRTRRCMSNYSDWPLIFLRFVCFVSAMIE